VRPSIDQIREDIAASEKIGAEEVILEVGFTLGGQSLSNWQKLLEEFPPSKGGGRKLGLGKVAVDVNVRIGISAPVLESGIRAWHL
jgi:hypothetical protein